MTPEGCARKAGNHVGWPSLCPPHSRIECVTQPVSEEVKTHEHQRHQRGWGYQQDRMNRNRFCPFLSEHAQERRRRRNTKSEETEESFGENHRWDGERGVDDDWPERVRKNVPRHDAEIGNT